MIKYLVKTRIGTFYYDHYDRRKIDKKNLNELNCKNKFGNRVLLFNYRDLIKNSKFIRIDDL